MISTEGAVSAGNLNVLDTLTLALLQKRGITTEADIE